MVPGVAAAVNGIEAGHSEVEIVTIGIAGIDAEVPETVAPVEGAIEVGGVQECPVLPVEQYIAQIEVAMLPVEPIEVVIVVDTHEVVEVDLVCCLILLFGEVELVGHLVGEEQSLLASLLIAHCAGRDDRHADCCEGDE